MTTTIQSQPKTFTLTGIICCTFLLALAQVLPVISTFHIFEKATYYDVTIPSEQYGALKLHASFYESENKIHHDMNSYIDVPSTPMFVAPTTIKISINGLFLACHHQTDIYYSCFLYPKGYFTNEESSSFIPLSKENFKISLEK